MTFDSDAIVSSMARPRRLREAETREGMRQVNVWLPEDLHRELVRLRERDRIGLNEAVRLSLRAWLARRKRREQR